MKKLISLLFIFLTYFNSFAQLDTEHWFAPMFDRASIYYYDPSGNFQYLYLSTNETTPFKVKVYNDNNIIEEVTISKGSPKKIFINRNFIISRNTDDLFKPIKKGLYVKGDKKFFANLRFSTTDHAEIITSKGLAGVGQKFYTVIPPITDVGLLLNFMTGIIATEDNTKIKVSKYKPNVNFTNHGQTPPILEFTLNKGESYIIEGENTYPNKTGFIGAKIESDKPISITNGNFNGQYAKVFNGSDIIMDQSVPVDRLGKEFAIVKGNGSIGKGLEGAIVVATENNTKVYVNNESSPIVSLNEGDYYVIPDYKYQQKNNEHYNLYIKSDKNIYLYQLLAGVQHSSATLGFNYIPPLNCFLPRQIGEIGLINEMDVVSWNKYTTIPTKLNFITIKDAKVEIENFSLKPEHGPFPLTGNNEWVTYSIPNVSGNINIKSSKSITAGISAGDGVVGYGGYFAGFSTVPAIRKIGDCSTGIILEIDDIYDHYQWYLNGKEILGANTHRYTPTQSGKYIVKVTNDSCSQTTAEFEVESCITETTIEQSICSEHTFIPGFSNNPQKQIDPNSITIIKNPNKGTANINKNKPSITYLINPNATGTDNFSYKFCEQGNPNNCEVVNVNITINGIKLHNASVNMCNTNSPTIDLTTVEVGATIGTTLSFYKTKEDAVNKRDTIANTEQYTPASDNETIYVLGSFNSCESIAEIHITKGFELNNSNLTSCSINGKGVFNLESANIGDTNGLTITYYESKEDAEQNKNPIQNYTTYNSIGKKVFVRAVNQGNCIKIVEIDLILHPEIALQNATLESCNINGVGTFNLQNANIGSTSGLTISYHKTKIEAESGSNPINDPANYQSANGKVYAKAVNDKGCYKIIEIDLVLLPEIQLQNTSLYACSINGNGIFNLETANIGDRTGLTINYYRTETDANNNTNPINNINNYSSNGRKVYAKATNKNGCTGIAEISLHLHSEITLQTTPLKTCSINGQGIFNLKNAIIGNTQGLTFTYHESKEDAEQNKNPIKNHTTYNSIGKKVFVRAVNQGNCIKIVEIDLILHPEIALQNATLESCNINGIGTFNLQNANIGNTSGLTLSYHKSKQDAETGNNPIQNITNYQSSDSKIFIKATNANNCSKIVEVDLVLLPEIQVHNTSLNSCSINGQGIFNLTTANIGDTTGLNISYHKTKADAENGNSPINNPQNYQSTNGKVFVKITNAKNCSKIVEIDLQLNTKPTVNISNYNSSQCDVNFDGKIEVDFSKVTSQIVNSQAGYSVKYYASQSNADNNQNALANLWSYSNNTTVFIKVTSKEGCSIVETINFTIKDKINLITNEYTAQVCSSPNLQVNLADYLHHFININGVSATYYNSLDDAKNQQNPINGQVNLTQNSKFFIRLSSTTHCDNIVSINFNINQAVSSTTLKDAIVCHNGTTTLDAGTGFTHYKWSTGATTQTITVGKGQYWVELTSPSGCVHRQTVNVTEYDAISLTPATVSVCSVNNKGVFDLTTAKIGHKTGDIVKYYPTENDANAGTNEITQPNAYSSTEGKVYAKVTSQGGCSAVTEINLKFYAKPTINIANYNSSHCDINFDGKIEVDFSKVTSQIVNPQAGYIVKYYASQSDVDNNQNELPNLWSYAQNTTVYVKVTSKEGCSVVETINFTIKDRLNLIKNKEEITLCDTDFDAITEVNLADYISQFTNENVSATYYLSLADAQKAINAIPRNQKAKNQQKYYIRLGNATHCDNIAEISFKINTPKKSTTLKDVSICSTDTTVLEAGAGFAQYQWSTGETTSDITAKVGEYWVDLTTDTGCTYRQYVKVSAVESPKIKSIDIKENNATILAEGGTLPYEYSLDGRNWQSSNVFTNLQQGKKYTVFVRSKGGCEPVSQDFVIIKLVNLITPNGDGFNDVIDYSALTTKANAKFNVYDRYGALVFEGNNSNQFIWDGKAKGRPLPTASYWYQLEWQEPNTNTWVKTASWILLKNRE